MSMMRILFLLSCWLILVGVSAQAHHPRRTAADIARKQTEMLVRELHITDSVMRDTLFRMHLKYAEKRNSENYTRANAIECMLRIQEELKQILSPEQYEAFMNRQLDYQPRSPQTPCNWIVPHHHHGTPHPMHEEEHTPPPPSVPQPTDHQ